ncbi:MAG: double-strand break repair protein AddB [Pseudooceanicola sp.]|nr:double-strand break repair protein AddB [Pseudooceanicola sp.]
MFEPTDTPRLFALPPGVDFPGELIRGLTDRMAGQSPLAMAQVDLVVNTRRMARRLRDLFDTGPARLLPRISLVTDVVETWLPGALPPSAPPLRRRLELAQLVARLIKAQPDLAARHSVYDLADSLADLLDEMQGEGVSAETIRTLDVTDMSGHWARAQSFIGIVETYLDEQSGQLDPQARQRRAVQTLIEQWAATPPEHPVILAGSTGSRGTTHMLIDAVARLPQGAVVLPGFDFDQPGGIWADMSDARVSEDHPQFRFSPILQGLDLQPGDVRRWTNSAPASEPRNRLVSLALRPAPFTDAWLTEGPALTDLDAATQDMTLVEAADPRAEAICIALRLRQAAEDGETAALITPDRMLTRRVAAALDRWGIVPDDSAGLPLHLSPPGRFLRHVAQLATERLTAERLVTLLKHPLTHTGADRGPHNLYTRDTELRLRRHGPPFPDRASLTGWIADDKVKMPPSWIDWVCDHICEQPTPRTRPLAEWVDWLRHAAEAIARGTAPEDSGALWERNAGQSALQVVETLAEQAAHGGDMTASEFHDLLDALLRGEEVRDRDAPHPNILIWGTLEARVQGAGLLILGGLNEGTWPESPSPDPWLNRRMRHAAGLLLPERQIGLSAHDFQQAIAAPQVWLTRPKRSDDAETVPSRWLNRLKNLLSGIPGSGQAALARMQARGDHWLALADASEKVTPVAPARRPAPRPPVAARPRKLSVTEIKRLIRDPFAIYAKHVLRLKPLDPLIREPDALLRGIVIHEALEDFIKASVSQPEILTRETFLNTCREQLDTHVPWPVARQLWLARLAQVADDFLRAEQVRQRRARPAQFEPKGELALTPLDFTINGKADRIDIDEVGQLHIFDYKTGRAPTVKQQALFDKQLLIESAMAEQGGFAALGHARVARATFLGLGGQYHEVDAPLEDTPAATVLDELRGLIGAYLTAEQGFTARLMLQSIQDIGEYDHLARYGEWDLSDPAVPEDLT